MAVQAAAGAAEDRMHLGSAQAAAVYQVLQVGLVEGGLPAEDPALADSLALQIRPAV